MPASPPSTYPADPAGPLCPLLDDGDLLLQFYEGAGAKPDIKKFIKKHRWPGKPPLSYSVGPETMKKMLLSLNGSAPAREILRSASARLENSPELYQVIWNWLGVNDPQLVETVDAHAHTEGDRVFLSAEELKSLMAALDAVDDPPEGRTTHLAYLVLAFAMLQPDDAPGLLSVLAARHPELSGPVGLNP